MARPIFLKEGSRYGALVVVSYTGERDSNGRKKYLCNCDCGNTVVRTDRYLTRKGMKTYSCGCQYSLLHHKTHGYSKTDGRLYRLWQAMRWRSSENNLSFKTYREKSVSCCEEWNDYLNFRNWALSNGYSDNLTLDRIDNNGGYSPENCRWADLETQANNKSTNTLITVNGETHTMAEWSRIADINYSTLRSRLNRQRLTGDKLFAKTEVTRDAVTGRFVGGYDL